MMMIRKVNLSLLILIIIYRILKEPINKFYIFYNNNAAQTPTLRARPRLLFSCFLKKTKHLQQKSQPDINYNSKHNDLF